MNDQNLINNAISNPGYAQIAKVFKVYYPNLFMCTDAKVNPWYIAPFYEHHKTPIQWKRMKGHKDLISFIDTYFTPLFEQMQINMYDSITDPYLKKDTLDTVMRIGELINNLQNKNFKEELCKELKFYYMKIEL